MTDTDPTAPLNCDVCGKPVQTGIYPNTAGCFCNIRTVGYGGPIPPSADDRAEYAALVDQLYEGRRRRARVIMIAIAMVTAITFGAVGFYAGFRYGHFVATTLG